MAQNVLDYSYDPTGNELMDEFLPKMAENCLTNNSGSTRPTYAVENTVWVDTSDDDTWRYKIYDGTSDIVLFELDNITKKINFPNITGVFRFKGSVATVSALPTTGNFPGDVYNVVDGGANYAWNGSEWDKLSENLEWGRITGTLSNQTDLQNALDAKANDSDVVKLTGDQSINGVKTFNNNSFTKNLYVKGIITLGTSTNTWGHVLEFRDTAGKRIARVQPMAIDTTKNRMGMWVNNADNTVEKGIEIWSDGTTVAPTPATSDNSTKIATTAYVKNQGYVTTSALNNKQDTLVSGTNIKTVNGTSLLGSGDITIGAQVSWGGVTGTLSNQTDLQNALNLKQNVASAVNYDNISNCITEIPQDVKLELNNGTLTLKAGSKLYQPNGTGVFSVIDISEDKTRTGGLANKKTMFFWDVSANGIRSRDISLIYSGSTAPGDLNSATWYDTANNKIKFYGGSGSLVSSSGCFPLCICTSDSSANIVSIDQVFNGFGYIGSTVFALPGVKGLIPNGRNADGTLKNIEFETIQVNIHTQTNKQNYANIYLASNFIFPSDVRNYSNEENYNYNINSGNIENNICEVGSLTRTSTSPYAITSLTPKTAFHAVDYNDFKQADDNNVKLTGDQTVAGTKTFSSSPVIPTPASSDNSTKAATTAYFRNNMQVVTALPASPTAGVFYFVKE